MKKKEKEKKREEVNDHRFCVLPPAPTCTHTHTHLIHTRDRAQLVVLARIKTGIQNSDR